MTKKEFLEKHELSELDYRNLIRYEEARKTGKMNMFEYLEFMKTYNLNGGKKLATWISSSTNYAEFREVLENE